MVESEIEVCSLVIVGEGNPKRMWWNDQVKAAVERKEVFGARDEDTMEIGNFFGLR